MTREIKTYPDPVLREQNCEVEAVTDSMKALAKDMIETMYANKGIGLAAPQIGENLKLITVDISGGESGEDPIVLFNPQLGNLEGESESEEGCLSVPEFTCMIKRAERLTVSGLDVEGEPVTLEAEGLLAVCLQHEVDHLQGRLILDHASRLKRNMYDKKVSKWQKRTP